jgi:Pyridoxamine 5'-phosphate oxidase
MMKSLITSIAVLLSLVLVLASASTTTEASTAGCYHPDDHQCDCEDGLTQSLCEQDESAGNVWTEECNCGQGNESDENQDEKRNSSKGKGGEGAFAVASPDQDAATARWLLQEALWGTVTTLSNSPLEPSKEQTNEPKLSANILPFAADRDTGRLFLYLMDEQHLHAATLTVSQASLNAPLFSAAGCGTDTKSVVDAQDPRCAKLSVSGSVHPCSARDSVPADCEAVGREALYRAHPSMQDWPDDHNFIVHELVPTDDGFWMLANFGGGGTIPRELYHGVKDGEISPHHIQGGTSAYLPPPKGDGSPPDMPHWIHRAARARWLVHHGLWTTVSTYHHSSKEQDNQAIITFGNIRSVTDGGIKPSASTGLPVFCVPDVDPTAVDLMEHDMEMALTFTEAALAERVTAASPGLWSTCAGQEAGMPTCAQVTLYGKAKVLSKDSSDYEKALAQFEESHPLAPWLAEGGSHMGGHYYTIEPTRVALLDFFGGVVDIPIEEYLAVSPVENAESGEIRWINDDGLEGPTDFFLSSIVSSFFWILLGCLFGCCGHRFCVNRYQQKQSVLPYEKIGAAKINGDNGSYTDQDADALSLEEEFTDEV